jgi:hypothetical protein
MMHSCHSGCSLLVLVQQSQSERVQLRVRVCERLQKQKDRMGSLKSHLKSFETSEVAIARLGH